MTIGIELSRRAAAALQWPPLAALDIEERHAFVRRVQGAVTFEDLLEEDRALIMESEVNVGVPVVRWRREQASDLPE